MTTTETPRKPSKSRAGERILAAGLASTACIGLVGVVGVRAAQSGEADTESADVAQQVSSQGLTQADLDAYAAQLAEQAAQLKAYRKELKKVAKQLNAEVVAYNRSLATSEPVYVEVPAANTWSGGGGNAPAPAPAPAPQPQSQSNSS